MDKTDIEEDIKICKGFIEENKNRPIILHKAIENILADRERKIEDIQRLQELLDKSDANNVKLEKEVNKYKNMYEAEHRIHLVRNEQLAKKEIAVLKANKYDNLIKMLEEILNNKYIMVFDGRVEYVDNEMIMKDTKYIKATALQELLETIEGEKK